MITPVEIRNQNFGRSLRGFDPEDVKAFLNSLSQEWETILVENKTLKIELEKTQETLNGYREMEAMLHRTLIQAEQSSKLVVENAQREAELKIMEAEQHAHQVIQSASLDADIKLQEADQRAHSVINRSYDERSRIEMEINQLLHRRNEIINQLHLYLSSQLERIKTFQSDEMVRLTVEPTEQVRRHFEHPSETAPSSNDNATVNGNTAGKMNGNVNGHNGNIAHQEEPTKVLDIRPEPVVETETEPVPQLEPIDLTPKPEPVKTVAPTAVGSFAYADSQSFFERAMRTPERAGLISAIADDL